MNLAPRALAGFLTVTGCSIDPTLPDLHGFSVPPKSAALYRRQLSDSLTVCANHGFVVTTQTDVIEGRYTAESDAVTAVVGDTGVVAFTLSYNSNGTLSMVGLGDGIWIEDEVPSTSDLDHADVQCSDLVTRAWWSTP